MAKLAAFREKDLRFVTELAADGLIDIQIARERLETTALHPVAKQRATGLLETLSGRATKRGDQAHDLIDIDASGPQADAARLRHGERLSRDPQVRPERPPPGPTIG